MKYTKKDYLNKKIAVEFQNFKDYDNFCNFLEYPTKLEEKIKYKFPIKVRFNAKGNNYTSKEDVSYDSYYEKDDYFIEQYSLIDTFHEIY